MAVWNKWRPQQTSRYHRRARCSARPTTMTDRNGPAAVVRGRAGRVSRLAGPLTAKSCEALPPVRRCTNAAATRMRPSTRLFPRRISHGSNTSSSSNDGIDHTVCSLPSTKSAFPPTPFCFSFSCVYIWNYAEREREGSAVKRCAPLSSFDICRRRQFGSRLA